MNSNLIACAQMGWPKNTPEEQILTTIARLGYDGAPAGPHKGSTAKDVLALYQKCGLKPAPGYYAADYWRAEQREEILRSAQAMGRFTRELGLTEVYVATGGWNGYVGRRGLHRGEVAGRVTPDDGLTEAEWQVFTDTLNQTGAILLAEGVRACYHNHVGSVTESGEEMDYLLTHTDPGLIFLGPDTGHLAWAGVDVVQFTRKYASRILTIHVKDVKMAVVKQGVAAGWDYGGFSSQGVFTELGDGDVDFPTVFSLLQAASFCGWIVVETDVITRPTPEESHRVSREYLQNIGI
jgi:inosose dehydratase